METSFRDFIWNNKWNRLFLLLSVAAFIIQFVIFKVFYPFPNFIWDSNSYLRIAYWNNALSLRPVAYGQFLRDFHFITHSDTALVAFQYFLFQISALVLLISLLYFFRPGRIASIILWAFFVFNPLSLYLNNYILSDGIFAALCMLWFAQLIWVIGSPKRWHIATQAILLLALFIVRYNAIYFPVIAAIAFLLSKQGYMRKLAGITLGSAFIIIFVIITGNKIKKETGGKWQFAPFSGWQLANNAMYAYEHVAPKDRDTVPTRFTKLEKMVREHMDTLDRVRITYNEYANFNFYIWNPRSPIKLYMFLESKTDPTKPFYLKDWMSLGPFMGDYGRYIISRYPLAFSRYFLAPNALKYANPPIEFLTEYNLGEDTVEPITRSWFDYKTPVIKRRLDGYNITALDWYPFFCSMANVFLLICIVCFLYTKGWKNAETGTLKLIVLSIFFWLANMGFSIFSSPIVLRYQVFPITLAFSLSLLLLRFIEIRK